MKDNNQNSNKGNGKKRFNFRISDEVMDLVCKWYESDNCATRNEFMEKAIRFYVGYVASNHNQDYLPNIVISTMKSIMRDSENRHNRNLFRIAVELSMLMNDMAATHDISKEALTKLRGDCVEEIKRINGTLSLNTAVDWQS